MPTPRPAPAAPAPARGGATLVALGALLWGTGGIAAATIAAHGDASPTTVSALRLLLGGLAMLVVTGATGQLRRIPRTAASARHVALTAALTAVFGGAYFQSVAHVGVAVATVVALGGAPLGVAAHGAVRARALPRPAVLVALGASVLGLVLVTGVRRPVEGDPGDLAWGLVLALVAAGAFAATTVVNRRVLPGLGPAPLIATSFTLAGLVSFVPALPAGLALGTLDATAWGTLGFLGLVQTAVGYLAFYAGLQRGVGATSAALLSLLEPVGATVLAVLLLGERVTPAAAAGIVLVLGAVLLAGERPAPRRVRGGGPRGRPGTAPRADAEDHAAA